MLKGLAIRQGFLIADLVLACLIAIISVMAVMRMFDSDIILAGPTGEFVEPKPLDLAKLAPREEYALLADHGLFGDAAKQKKADEVVVEEPVEPVAQPIEETTLPLQLLGTFFMSPDDALASAIIQDGTKQAPLNLSTYYIGQPVMPDVVLAAVHKKAVILHNQTKQTYEILKMEDAKANQPGLGGLPLRPNLAPSPMAQAPAQPGVYSVQRQELVNEVAENPTELVAKVSPRLAYDDSGNVQGITSPNIAQLPMAQKLGFQQDDIVQAINGEAIQSEQDVFELINKYYTAPVHRVTVLRNGTPQVLTIRLE